MKRPALLALIVGSLIAGSAHAFPWNFDMQDQQSVKAQETDVPLPPEGAVPITGGEPVPITQEVSKLLRGRIDSARLVNPVAADEVSIARGQKLYDTVCAICHGQSGAGDGPVGLKFIARPFDLRIDYVQQKQDGELFFTITNGGVVMPYYRDALTPDERWDVVNYVKRGLTRSDEP